MGFKLKIKDYAKNKNTQQFGRHVFCPESGQQITFEDDYRPSDASRFTFLQDWSSFAYIHDSLLPILEFLNLDAAHVDLEKI